MSTILVVFSLGHLNVFVDCGVSCGMATVAQQPRFKKRPICRTEYGITRPSPEAYVLCYGGREVTSLPNCKTFDR